MKALNSRRPQPSTFLRLLLLLLFAVHDGRARSVNQENHPVQPKGRTLATREWVDEFSKNWNDLTTHLVEGNSKHLEKRFVATPAVEKAEPKTDDVDAAREWRKIDVAELDKPAEEKSAEGKPVEEAKDQGIRRFDGKVDPEVADAKSNLSVESDPGSAREWRNSQSSEESNSSPESEETNEGLPSHYRKSGALDDKAQSSEEAEESEASRESKAFADSPKQSKRKSSTVYLNAEEKKVPDGEQQSIVEGQLKKLISIRDDVLDAQKAEEKTQGETASEFLSGKREIAAIIPPDDAQSELKDKVKHSRLRDSKQSIGNGILLKKWRDQAVSLQEQIRNRTYLLSLKEQATEVLPEIPRFTEKQLLNILEQVVLLKRSQLSNESSANDLQDLPLTNVQQQIIKCAEQLLAVRERQGFTTNLSECIRGLSVWNCLRIFVWPLVVDNLPDSIKQSLVNLPIEINVLDLLQGPKQKSGRDLHQVQLIAPEVVVYSILQDALETYPSEESISYLDPKNETLQKLLSSSQLSILQMAEKFVPQSLRQQYSDRMYSCVSRFEYFSCVKYYTWPTIKQFSPSLPSFPIYQTWYPIFPLYPQYPPILPASDLPEDLGELPEVVDADATRSQRPRPETVIGEILQDILEKQSKTAKSLSFLDQSTDSYVALIPRDQLQTINMAEQLIPASLRPEFIEKTVDCIRNYNYLTCIKYSTWPTVKQFVPTLPDISAMLPDYQMPELTDFFIPVSNIQNIPTVPIVPELENTFLEDGWKDSESLSELVFENYAKRILQDAQKSASKSSELPVVLKGRNGITLTESQLDILKLSMRLVPTPADAELYDEVLDCIPKNKYFSSCARVVIWPTLVQYVPNFPQLPEIQIPLEYKASPANSGVNIQERINSDAEKEKIASSIPLEDQESRSKVRENIPVISVTGTRFFPIFTEHPETVVLNILKSVRLRAVKLGKVALNVTVQANGYNLTASTPGINWDVLNDVQKQIVTLVADLIPAAIKTNFTNELIACLEEKSFLTCSREVIWPTLQNYLPWVPTFPNFGISFNRPGGGTSLSSPPSPSAPLTEPSPNSDAQPLSETNVKTGQHGNTIVTITDTRFFPIFIEEPEAVLFNILRGVQLSIPSFIDPPAPLRTQEFSKFLTEQQINLIQIAENLIPVNERPDFIGKISACTKQFNFLECMENITWPLVSRTYPWVSKFPNFGKNPNLPRIGIQVLLAENPSTPKPEEQAPLKEKEVPLQASQDKMENILSQSKEKSNPQLGKSYLMDLESVSHLTVQQLDVLKKIANGIPEAHRASYLGRLLACTRYTDFSECTQRIDWPSLKEFHPIDAPALPFNIQPGTLNAFPGPGSTWIVKTLEPSLIPESGINSDEITPSVDTEGDVLGYPGQPAGIHVDISKEKVELPDDDRQHDARINAKEANKRKRRDTIELLNAYYDSDETLDAASASPQTSPNMTESEYLQLLIKIKGYAQISSTRTSTPQEYFVDTLNSSMRNSLTADQYEILKLVEDIGGESGKGLMSQVVRCIWSLSFLRCMGIFVWPLIVNNLPTLIPSFGFGRTTDTEQKVQEFFGMSSSEFEKELLSRKESIENSLLDWYKKLVEEEFETNVGFLKIRGYGNGKLGISCAGFREARGAKLKDNKNLPSILTIISDIMEEVLDQRPDGEKGKKEKEKKERSIDDAREADIQFLKDTEEYGDIKRSMNDDEIITMFLNKLRSNDSEADKDKENYFASEDAYNAFGVLFGTRLTGRLANKLQTQQLRSLDEVNSDEPQKEVDIVPLESEKSSDELKVLPLSGEVAYAFEKESTGDQEERRRQKRAKNFKSFLENYSDKYLNDADVENSEDIEDNKIRNIDELREKDTRSSLVVQLPQLDKEILSRKITNTMEVIGRVMKTKMTNMMPGFGLIVSFLLQTALAHARAAASLAGMLSNMALGSAMIGMIRDTMFGSNSQPQIKYVYDNDKMGPGISWPSHYESGPHYHG